MLVAMRANVGATRIRAFPQTRNLVICDRAVAAGGGANPSIFARSPPP